MAEETKVNWPPPGRQNPPSDGTSNDPARSTSNHNEQHLCDHGATYHHGDSDVDDDNAIARGAALAVEMQFGTNPSLSAPPRLPIKCHSCETTYDVELTLEFWLSGCC